MEILAFFCTPLYAIQAFLAAREDEGTAKAHGVYFLWVLASIVFKQQRSNGTADLVVCLLETIVHAFAVRLLLALFCPETVQRFAPLFIALLELALILAV
jgi:hypothetical protein